MEKSKILISILTLIGLMLSGCSVTNDTVECPSEFTGDLLESEMKLIGKWYLTALVSDTAVDLTADSTNNPSVDIFGQYSECSRDALFTFGPNRAYTYEKGTRTPDCDETVSSGSWKLSLNELFLVVSCGQLSLNLSFDENNSEFEYSGILDIQEVNGFVRSTNVTFTFSKIE